MQATIISMIILAVFIAISHAKLAHRIRSVALQVARLESERVYLHQKINEYEIAAKKMAETAESNEEYLKQAMKTEQLLQEGINSIMNFDAMSYMRGGDK